MKKQTKITLIITGVIFALFFIAFMIVLIVSSNKLDYAINHYKVTYKTETEVIAFTKIKLSGYGCGELDCEYCNGQELLSSFDAFLLHNKLTSLIKTSKVIMGISLVVCAGIIVLLVLDKFKVFSKTKQDE